MHLLLFFFFLFFLQPGDCVAPDVRPLYIYLMYAAPTPIPPFSYLNFRLCSMHNELAIPHRGTHPLRQFDKKENIFLASGLCSSYKCWTLLRMSRSRGGPDSCPLDLESLCCNHHRDFAGLDITCTTFHVDWPGSKDLNLNCSDFAGCENGVVR
ncbi:uncharacterized protein F4812DRAFT_252072 [Daldinia caldariorum]|uniref:uncharacterized protein n=1 Tax=Daldinia caldariorum TaxID=326644 RepID=UPI002008511B|nr:uncharacterized protein F4812DRAFT_252072 [Daldinia caldariorum]KAI1463339.1 hypothetical protein F4812DRAFT_252072 [Daldinia caldariorum]